MVADDLLQLAAWWANYIHGHYDSILQARAIVEAKLIIMGFCGAQNQDKVMLYSEYYNKGGLHNQNIG